MIHFHKWKYDSNDSRICLVCGKMQVRTLWEASLLTWVNPYSVEEYLTRTRWAKEAKQESDSNKIAKEQYFKEAKK